MTKAAANTSLGPMVSVAIEQSFPEEQRIIDDGLVYRLLPASMRAYVSILKPAWLRDWMINVSDKAYPGIWGGVLCRKRYIDETLVTSSGTLEAVVNLGTGLDSRAYRLPVLSRIKTWEVDQPVIIESKRARLQKALGDLPGNVTLVPIDFDRDQLDVALASHGYQPGRTFFIWEAVSQYLAESGIRTTFDYLSKAARGSRLVFTYIRKDFIDGQEYYGMESMYKRFVIREGIWIFGLYPGAVVDFLRGYGWRVLEHLGYDQLAGRYVKPTGRALATTDVERIVYAEKV